MDFALVGFTFHETGRIPAAGESLLLPTTVVSRIGVWVYQRGV
jgi:hypothetical protein